MKKILSLVLIFINIFIFAGCGNLNVNVTDSKTKTLLEGQWRVQKVEVPGVADDREDNIEGSIFSFSNDVVLLFDKIYEDISYKAKVVNKEQYIYDVLGYIPDNLRNYSEAIEDIKVVSISANNSFIKDIMFMDDNGYIIEDGRLYKLIRIDKEPIKTINSPAYEKEDDYYKIDSGVLIGLRSEGYEGTEYRTFWISNEKGDIKIEELPYLLLPRKTGFFKVSNKREYNAENYFQDTIVFQDMNGKTFEFHSDIIMNLPEDINIDQDITFIGNDYMSTKVYKYNDEFQEEILSTYILDLNTAGINKPIPLGTLTDSSDMSNIILSSDENNILNNKDLDTFTNFAIKRKQGRWSFYTLNPGQEIEKIRNKDNSEETDEEVNEQGVDDENIDITLRVSEKIARHDKIFIPWQGIQRQVPSVVDAISAPNRNLAVIRTKSKLYIYKIINNNLDKASEVVVPLYDKESIVMAEWAEGDYVGYWSEHVKHMQENNK